MNTIKKVAVYFHLVEHDTSPEYPFAFLATYTQQQEDQESEKQLPLKYALEQYKDDDRGFIELMATIEEAKKQSRFIENLVRTGEIFHPLTLSAGDAYTFLKEIPLYENCGIACRIPDWWKKRSRSVKVDLSIGSDSPKHLGSNALLQFNAKILLAGEEITPQEAEDIIKQTEGLAYIKGKWIVVDKERLQNALAALKKAHIASSYGSISFKDAMRMYLSKRNFHAIDSGMLQIKEGKWISETFKKLQSPETIKSILPDESFKAKLRKYQQDGLNWLFFLHKLKFGACLADDMGLGKTIQVLAFLNGLRTLSHPSLLVVPASLLANWESEIKKFTPKMKYFIAHPSFHTELRKMGKNENFIEQYNLIITTYALIQKYTWLRKYTWNYIILDEAQAIKNPMSKQTISIKGLNAFGKIAMTGTPIENNVIDLWSLYDFINPGLLGNFQQFREFAMSLREMPEQYEDLQKVVAPYMLRRLKTDKSIIADLPDKIEMKTYAYLSRKQVFLYQELIKEIKKDIKELQGDERKVTILSSLQKFKQICNHPGQYLGNQDYTEQDSGKFQRLRSICEVIFQKRERVLIFTQFKEITQPLYLFLTKIAGKEGLVLHGGTSVKKRKELVETFQSKQYVPFFILSVKAGGVGLNLTEANHVIHFDRWWNPAVENQATDRAFRIGQKKKVLVHKFITMGTIEEKIDTILQEKIRLSGKIVQCSAASLITELSNDELFAFFQISKDFSEE